MTPKGGLIRGVAYALDGHGLRHFLNVKTGVINTFAKHDLYARDWEDIIPRIFYGNDFLEIRPYSSKESFAVMEDFVEYHLKDKEQAIMMEALGMRRPFERFRNVLYHHPAIRDKWYAFKAEHFRQAATGWITGHGLDPEAQVSPEDFLAAITDMLVQREMDPTHFQSLDEDYEEEAHMEHFGVGSAGMDDG